MTGTIYPSGIDGYVQLPLVVDGVDEIRADDLNRVRNAVVAVEAELGINPSGTFGTVKARLDSLETGGGGGTPSQVSDYIAGQIELPDSTVTYRLIINSPFSGTITTVTTLAATGTGTFTVYINGVALDGSPNAVSTVEDIQGHVANNVFNVGDEVTVQVTNNFGLQQLSFLLDIIRANASGFPIDTGQNVGLKGFGLFKKKSGDTLQFRNLAAGSAVIAVGLDNANNDVTIDVVQSGLDLGSMGGVVPVTKGGTGRTNAIAAFTNLSPVQTKGDVLATDGTTNQPLAVGHDGYVLTANSAASVGLSWMPQIGGGGGGSPGGISKSVQYNNAGAFAGSTSLLWDNASGRLGIGKDPAPPDGELDNFDFLIARDGQGTGTRVLVNSNTVGEGFAPAVKWAFGRGTHASPAAVHAGDVLADLQLAGYDTSSYFAAARIQATAQATWTTSNRASQISFYTTPASSSSVFERVRIGSDLLTVNAAGQSYDFTVLNASSNPALRIFASTGLVGINTAAANEALTLSGVLSVSTGVTPSATAAFGKFYAKTSDGLPYYLDPTGTEHALTGGGGGTPGGSNTDIQFNNSGAFGGTGLFTWNNSSNTQTITGTTPTVYLNQSSASLDQKNWFVTAQSNQLQWGLNNDALNSPADFLIVSRSSARATSIDFQTGASPTTRLFIGTGLVGFGTNNPAVELHVLHNQNNPTTATVENDTTGANATSAVSVIGQSSYAYVQANSDSFSRNYAGAHPGAALYWGAATNGLNIISALGPTGSAGANTGVIRFITGNVDLTTETPGNDARTKMVILQTGLVGIGTTTPTVLLHQRTDQSADTSHYIENRSTGAAARSVTLLGDVSTEYGYVAYSGSGYSTIGLIQGRQLNINSTNGSTGGMLFTAQGGPWVVAQGGFATTNERIRVNATEILFNGAAQDIDFQVEGQADPNLIFADAGVNQVGIGTATTNEKLTLNGVLSIAQTTTPSLTAGYGKFYPKSDGYAYFLNSSGVEYNLTMPVGGGGGTPAGSTGAIQFNTSGAFNADVSNLFWDNTAKRLGVDTSTPNSAVQINGSFSVPLVYKTGTYTLTSADYTVLANANSGPFTLNLPTAAGIGGRIYVLKKIDASGNAVTIQANGAEFIDGANTQTLTAVWESITIQSDGVDAWYVL